MWHMTDVCLWGYSHCSVPGKLLLPRAFWSLDKIHRFETQHCPLLGSIFLGKSSNTYSVIKRVQWDNAYDTTYKLLNTCKKL